MRNAVRSAASFLWQAVGRTVTVTGTGTAAPTGPLAYQASYRQWSKERLRLESAHVQSDVISGSIAGTSHSSRVAVRAKRAAGESGSGGGQMCGMAGVSSCPSRQKRWSSVHHRWAQAYSTLPFSAFGLLGSTPRPLTRPRPPVSLLRAWPSLLARPCFAAQGSATPQNPEARQSRKRSGRASRGGEEMRADGSLCHFLFS
jgi:hypothetical protein